MHPAYASLHYQHQLQNMVLGPTSCFSSKSTNVRAAAGRVIFALLAFNTSPNQAAPKAEGGRFRGPPQRDKQEKNKFNLGANLQAMLNSNSDRFAFAMEDLKPAKFSGEPTRLELTSDKPIFRPLHKLGQVELDFVEAQCAKLEKLGFIGRSPQSQYASATVVVRKKDEEGNYTDFRQCGDYRPLNQETPLDSTPLPGIEDIFNQMGGGTIFSKLNLRSGYHQMPLRQEDRAKTAFWGANKIL